MANQNDNEKNAQQQGTQDQPNKQTAPHEPTPANAGQQQGGNQQTDPAKQQRR